MGAPDTILPLLDGHRFRRRVIAETGSARVDLAAVRASGRPYVAGLGPNTRSQIRRACRLYDERGGLRLDAARGRRRSPGLFRRGGPAPPSALGGARQARRLRLAPLCRLPPAADPRRLELRCGRPPARQRRRRADRLPLQLRSPRHGLLLPERPALRGRQSPQARARDPRPGDPALRRPRPRHLRLHGRRQPLQGQPRPARPRHPAPPPGAPRPQAPPPRPRPPLPRPRRGECARRRSLQGPKRLQGAEAPDDRHVAPVGDELAGVGAVGSRGRPG